MSFSWKSTTAEDESDNEESTKKVEKSSILFFLDASAQMLMPPIKQTINETPFVASLRCISKFLQAKIIDSNDHVGVVIYNTGTTKNPIDDAAAGFYELFPLGVVSADWIIEIEAILDGKSK
jgi:Ku70/Ku80 N-terminal alpha/beta domain